ncbi:MAG: helix-turn-helix transcriptional regulator [Steroidobacter sp.]
MIRHRPGAPLNAAVDCIWWSSRSDDSRLIEHMLPSGKPHLIFALHDAPIRWAPPDRHDAFQAWTRGIVHGPQSSYYVMGPKPKGRIIGVSFHAGTAGAILGVPLDELQDRHVCIEDIWGHRAIDLRERLALAATAHAAIKILERDLIARLQRPLLLHPAVAQALRPAMLHGEALSAVRVAEIQKRSGYSARHFIQLFRANVGLAPKQFYRIQRFSSALSRIARGGVTLADVAISSGYSDQAHLSREFRELAGVTPSVYSPPAADAEHHHVVGPR